MSNDRFKPNSVVITFGVDDLSSPKPRHHLPAGSKIRCLCTRMNTHVFVKHTPVFRKGESKGVQILTKRSQQSHTDTGQRRLEGKKH